MAEGVDVAIISSGHDVADARLHKITKALLRRGLSVELRGLGDSALGPSGTTVVAIPRSDMRRRAIRAARVPWQPSARVLVTVDPDTVPMAKIAAFARRQRLVVDVHEDYLRLLSDRAWATGLTGLCARVFVRLSTRLAARADLTVVADTHLPPFQARRRLVVENLPDPSLLHPGPPDAEPRAIYIGDLRASRGLFDMVEVVAAAPGWRLDLVGPIAPADRPALEARLQRSDVSGRVFLHGRLSPDRAWKIAKGAWAGLAFLRETPAFREAMPSKVYEYLASGLPVISTRLPRQAAVIEESGAGVIVENPAEAVALLRQWAADPAGLEKYRGAAEEWRAGQQSLPSGYDDLAEAIARLLEK